MIQNKDIVAAKGDKVSSVVITKKSDYLTKLDAMINGSIMKGFYVEIKYKTPTLFRMGLFGAAHG